MQDLDRVAELKAFDESKVGVKGLVDAGVGKIPRFFVNKRNGHPADQIRLPAAESSNSHPAADLEIPIIDMRGFEKPEGSRRREIVDGVRSASETWGFFQVLNHGIPTSVLEDVMGGVRKFNEQPEEVRAEYYSRDLARKVKYFCNFDLYQARTANWRDTLFCRMAPDPPNPEELPVACRDILVEYSKHVLKLGVALQELLSEALGLSNHHHLKDMGCSEGHFIASHYYPACPEPDLTFGTSQHSDPSFLTILLQDHIGGLQVFRQDKWVDVRPIPGALVVNIGDLLQLISNDKLKSVEHRVLANSVGPRISVACFFTTQFHPSQKLYGPIKELLSDGNPPVYREITLNEFHSHYNSRGIGREDSALNHFKLQLPREEMGGGRR